jgi:2-phosphosulfolactate phosphatase
MEIEQLASGEGARAARGLTVLIDVFRAFSSAPLLLHLGAAPLILEGDVERCFALREQLPGARLVGSRNEDPIDGFDVTNSPWFILQRGRAFFDGRPVILRSTSGVGGAAAALDQGRDRGGEVLLASFLAAAATALHLRALQPERVTLVAMGRKATEPAPEDEACAACIAALLGGAPYDHLAAMAGILAHENAKKYFRGDNPALPREDPVVCLQLDLCDFALRAVRRDGWIEGVRVGSVACNAGRA